MGFFTTANLADYLFILLYRLFFFTATPLISWDYKLGYPKKIGLLFAWVGVMAAVLDGECFPAFDDC